MPTVSGSHTYAAAGSCTVTTTLGDSGGRERERHGGGDGVGARFDSGATPRRRPGPVAAPLVARFGVSASAPGSVTLDASATSGPAAAELGGRRRAGPTSSARARSRG